MFARSEDHEQAAFARYIIMQIDRMRESLPLRPDNVKLRPPNGSPIGAGESGQEVFMHHCEHGW